MSLSGPLFETQGLGEVAVPISPSVSRQCGQNTPCPTDDACPFPLPPSCPNLCPRLAEPGPKLDPRSHTHTPFAGFVHGAPPVLSLLFGQRGCTNGQPGCRISCCRLRLPLAPAPLPSTAALPHPEPGFLFAGVVTLISDYEVCREGDVLTPEQARVLVSECLAERPGGVLTLPSAFPVARGLLALGFQHTRGGCGLLVWTRLQLGGRRAVALACL